MRWVSLSLTVASVGIVLASAKDAIEFEQNWGDAGAIVANSALAIKQVATVEDGTCYLTVSFPEKAGKDLSKLTFSQRFAEADRLPIQFDLAKTKAFVGTPNQIGNSMGINALLDETLTVWVEFNPSVVPGTTFTVALQPEQDLSSEQRHEFVITAYPDTEKPIPQFLGNTVLDVDSTNFCQFAVPEESE
jgi:hypothetical protein